MKKDFRKHNLRVVAAFIAYSLGLFALNHFYSEQSPHRNWLILLPVLPIIYLAATTIRSVSVVDEMKRKIYTEAMAFSGVATAWTCFSYMFLRNMGAPEFHAERAFYIAFIYYWAGLFFSWRRYK
jgi:hypothetical protein